MDSIGSNFGIAAVSTSYLCFPSELCPRHACPCNYHVQVGDYVRMILLFLLHCLFCLCTSEVLYGLVVLFARMLGLHAESAWTCRSYTFMLLENIIFRGIFSDTPWNRRWPAWFVLLWLSYQYPLFPPKKSPMQRKRSLPVLSSSILWHHTGRYHHSFRISQGVNLCIRNSRN